MKASKTQNFVSGKLLPFSVMPRQKKRRLIMVGDFLALLVALWSGYAIRMSEWWPAPHLAETAWFFIAVPVLGIFLFNRLGLYKTLFRYLSLQAFWTILKVVVVLAIVLIVLDTVLVYPLFPRSVPIAFALSALVFTGGMRFIITQAYQWGQKHYVDKESVLIYGAGSAGVQLATALFEGAEYYPVAFVDDDISAHGNHLVGLKVYAPADIERLVQQYQISKVLLALPSVEHRKKKKILDAIVHLPVHVKTLPSMEDIVAGKADPNQLRDVDIADLLGRDPVPPQQELLELSVKDKVVLITGAGGSIGSEICRQVLYVKPAAIVLYELSEFALYQVEQSLQHLMVKQGYQVPVYALLGNVCDKARVRDVISRFKVQTIYHAAAYKHVPIVEHNVVQGIQNNVFGTWTVAATAKELNVERFVLVSTDKAVRPTNVMGATKRLAELVLQDMAQRPSNTVFSMVRFGNVLGSSGSVVPLFRKQISEGGPVTVTHPEITRFFMTIPEAASLVIQAGSMGEGGDVFVLDMGKPVKISELAERMIRLSGLEPKTEEQPDGDIEISYSGLRPGEKLYEELLIGESVITTSHPKIMRAREELLTQEQLSDLLDGLRVAVSEGDSHTGRDLLKTHVRGFVPSSGLVDLLASEAVLQ